jgi:acyl dehydratase
MGPNCAFEAAVDDFLEQTRELIGKESTEDLPLPHVTGNSDSRPVPSALVLDDETVRRYAHSIGDDNPLFTDPGYASESCYGSLIAPGPVLVHVRYPAVHGAARPHGYPLANFLAGVAWEFFDVVRPGIGFASTKVLREVFVRRGPGGRRLIHLVCEVSYFDALDLPIAKAYGTLVQVPMRTMGTCRAIPLKRLGEEMFSRRLPHRYEDSEIRSIVSGMSNETRRGAHPLYWEDVLVGAELPPIVQPPYTLQDAVAYQALHQGLFAGYTGGSFSRALSPAYRAHRAGWGYPDYARVHPVTRWPYTPGDEHEDAYLSRFRGQPLPFDFGIQRAQIPQRLVSNWAGDQGFCRKLSMTMHRPLFYGDAFIVRGVVACKSLVRDPLQDGANQHAVRLVMEGVNQNGEPVSRGYATMYLPTRDSGPPRLPLGYTVPPPYVPFRKHRSPSWY